MPDDDLTPQVDVLQFIEAPDELVKYYLSLSRAGGMVYAIVIKQLIAQIYRDHDYLARRRENGQRSGYDVAKERDLQALAWIITASAKYIPEAIRRTPIPPLPPQAQAQTLPQQSQTTHTKRLISSSLPPYHEAARVARRRAAGAGRDGAPQRDRPAPASQVATRGRLGAGGVNRTVTKHATPPLAPLAKRKNRVPPNSEIRRSFPMRGRTTPYQDVGHNIDTLTVNAHGTFLDGIPAYLDTMQAEALAERDADKYRGEVLIETGWRIAEMPLLIRPHGGGKGQWRWILTCPGVTLELGLGSLNGILCRARLGSAFLWEHGYRDAWTLVQDFLDTLGTFEYQPSEVHLCADIAGLPFTSLSDQAFITRGHVVRWTQEDAEILELEPSAHYLKHRAMVEVAVRYREPETITFSPRAAQSAAIYNKPREIRLHSRDKVWFSDIWKANGWDGETPIIRVEFRSEREVLHELGIEDMPSLYVSLDALWQYGSQDWLRHTVPQRSKRRTTWPTSPWWRVVQAVTFEREDAVPGQREQVRKFHERRMVSTIIGYAESYAAWKSGQVGAPSTLAAALALVHSQADDHYEYHTTNFTQRLTYKRRLIGAKNLTEGETK